MDRSSKVSRKEVLQGLIALPALAGLMAVSTTGAEAKSPKAAFKYQDKPKGSAKCSNCALFIPGKSASANGTCKVVEGAISPNGWCIAYTKKR